MVGDNTVFYGVGSLSLVCLVHGRSQNDQINIYSSPDLATWRRVGHAITPINGTDIGMDAVVERPKVIYNEPTKQWVVRTYPSVHSAFRCPSGYDVAMVARG